MRAIIPLAAVLVASSCQAPNPTSPDDAMLELLREDIIRMQEDLARAEQRRNLRSRSVNDDLIERVDSLSGSLDQLHQRVAQTCNVVTSEHSPEADACDTTREVVIADDMLLVGETEYVWIDPPGFQLNARVDTGAESSSLHAESVTEFERDGDNWVRFDVFFEDLSVTIERPVLKYVRVFQQSDKEGTRRPVVEMRVFLGSFQDTYEFTLADRSHLEHGVILGRNFLQDVALVDVSRQFVQPVYTPGEPSP
jgi:hypothetical protein